jgi:hypothetical protein
MDVPLAARLPGGIALLAKGEQDEIFCAAPEVLYIRRWSGGDYVKLIRNLTTVCGEGEIVDVLSRGIFDVAADGEQANDYIRRNYR